MLIDGINWSWSIAAAVVRLIYDCVCARLSPFTGIGSALCVCMCFDWAIRMYDELIQNSRIRFGMASMRGRIIKWLRVTETRKKSIKFIRRTKSVTVIMCVHRTRHTPSNSNGIEHPVQLSRMRTDKRRTTAAYVMNFINNLGNVRLIC